LAACPILILPPGDGQYYYRMVTVYAVGSGETLSALSNQANVVVNGAPPSATVVLQALGSKVDTVHNRLGVGSVQATVMASKALAAIPFFNLSVGGSRRHPGQSYFIAGTMYSAVFSRLPSATPSGAITPVFSAIDTFGNKGYSATMSVPWVVDTHGPTATGLTPVQIQSGIVTTLPVVDAYQNYSANPVMLSWRMTLDKATGGNAAPTSTATLSGHPGLSLPVTVASGGDSANQTWLLTLTLPADAGAQAENLVLAYSAADDLSNVGNTIVPPHSFQIYQGTLPPLGTPSGLTATALPAGSIQLTWNVIPNASSYILQVEGPGQTTFQNLTNPNGSTTQYAYVTPADGLYSFEIASVRSENGQNVPSGFSAPVSATSDRVPPNSPTAFSLQVDSAGCWRHVDRPVRQSGRCRRIRPLPERQRDRFRVVAHAAPLGKYPKQLYERRRSASGCHGALLCPGRVRCRGEFLRSGARICGRRASARRSSTGCPGRSSPIRSSPGRRRPAA
jgi:hypothetical protein